MWPLVTIFALCKKLRQEHAIATKKSPDEIGKIFKKEKKRETKFPPFDAKIVTAQVGEALGAKLCLSLAIDSLI